VSGWQRPEDIDPDPCVVTSVGYLLAGHKADHVTVVQSLEGEHVDGPLCVPCGMVRSVVVLVDGGTLTPHLGT
jgi:hypothetical protein